MPISPKEPATSPPPRNPVLLPRRDCRDMVRLVRLLFRLARNPTYRSLVLSSVPEWAGYDPGHDAVMMGFDFHLTPDGPKLIEVNTNAGGGLLALQASTGPEKNPLRRLRERLHRSFREEWSRFAPGGPEFPALMLILDEKPEDQFLFPEMLAFADLFREWGARAVIAGPEELAAGAEGVFYQGKRVDFIYNRHCDFYLESDAMEGIRRAYLEQAVCLSPNPFTYALLADKRRALLWSQPELLRSFGLGPRDRSLLASAIPECHLLSDMEEGSFWKDRANWVLKPATGFGSRGVILGRGMSRRRLTSLDPPRTVVQKFIPPSTSTPIGDSGAPVMKTDLRLFAYRNRLLGIAARVYHGQVTNLRSPGAGFAPVRLI